MIKDAELKKGNYIYFNPNGRPFVKRVKELRELDFICYGEDNPDQRLALYYTNGDVEPIPLTPEWLERCGLTENDRGYCVIVSGSFYLLKNDLKDENGNIEGYVLVSAGSHGLIQKPIYKYLHQLQNLFFALTSEELNVKL